MNCEQVRELAPLWQSGELGGSRLTALTAHLAGCAVCSHWAEEGAAVDVLIRQALEGEEPNTEKTRRAVLQRIESERRRHWILTAGIAAVILAALFVGFYIRLNKQQEQVFADAARDHQLEVLEHQPRHWRSDTAEVAVMAARFGMTGTKAFGLAPAGYRLLRAKTCSLAGQPVMHLVYTNGTRDVSFYVRPGVIGQDDTAQIGRERLASAQASGYFMVAVSTGNLEECREMARRAVHLL